MRFSDAAPASQGIPLALRASVGGQDSSGRPLGARGVPNTPALSKSCSPGKPRVAFGSAYKGPTTPKPTGIPSIASKSRTTPGGVGQTTPGPGVTTPGLQQLTASLGLSTSGARRYTPGPGPRRSSVQGGDQPGSARPPSRPGSSHGIIDNGPFNKGPGYKGEDAKKDAKIVDLRAPRKEHQPGDKFRASQSPFMQSRGSSSGAKAVLGQSATRRRSETVCVPSPQIPAEPPARGGECTSTGLLPDDWSFSPARATMVHPPANLSAVPHIDAESPGREPMRDSSDHAGARSDSDHEDYAYGDASGCGVPGERKVDALPGDADGDSVRDGTEEHTQLAPVPAMDVSEKDDLINLTIANREYDIKPGDIEKKGLKFTPGIKCFNRTEKLYARRAIHRLAMEKFGGEAGLAERLKERSDNSARIKAYRARNMQAQVEKEVAARLSKSTATLVQAEQGGFK